MKYHRPKAVSIEGLPSFINYGEFVSTETEQIRANRILKSGPLPFEAISLEKYKVSLKVSNYHIFDHSRCSGNSVNLFTETHAAITFALTYKIPFYFTEWDSKLGNNILCFSEGLVQAISLKGKTTYQDHPDEFYIFPPGRISISEMHLTARNRFTSDAINHLFDLGYNPIAHVGGTGHFSFEAAQKSPDRDLVQPLKEGARLTDLIKAQRYFYYDLVEETSDQWYLL